MKIVTMIRLAGTVLVLAGCSSLRGGQIEAFGTRSSLEHAAGAHETGEGIRLVTAPTDYGAQGVIGIGLQAGSNTFQGIQLETSRVVGDLGVRLGKPVGPFTAYAAIGAQPEMLRVHDTAGESDHSFALAGYGALGLELRTRAGLGVGLEYRATTGARFDLLDSPGVDMDDRTLSVCLGWGF